MGIAMLAAPVQAAHFTWSFAGPVVASGDIFTLDTLNAVGGYDITSFAGTIDGEAIVGLVPNPNQPNPANSVAIGSTGWLFVYDNVLFTPPPGTDINGVLVTTPTKYWNFYKNDGTDYLVGATLNPGGTWVSGTGNPGYAGVLTITPVPEVATWAMMIGGFAGLTMHRRRGSTAAAFAA